MSEKKKSVFVASRRENNMSYYLLMMIYSHSHFASLMTEDMDKDRQRPPMSLCIMSRSREKIPFLANLISSCKLTVELCTQ